MWDIIRESLSFSQYIPHGHCYLWQTPLVALHVVSNALIAIAYFSIPALLLYFVKKRRDVPFSNIFTLFGAFIILCGMGHLLDIWTLWHSDYWLSGLEHAVTAFVSCITALQMVTLLPQFLALKTPEQLEALNQALQQEILERQRTEADRNRTYEELEQTLRTLRLTQVQMIQAEKMSSLGRLVAGIAHEINNPVNFVCGNLTHTEEYTQNLLHLLTLYQTQVSHPNPEIQEFIEEIDLEFLREDLPKLLDSMRTGTQRIEEIVLSLRNFSRLDEAEIKAVNLHEGIDNTLVLLGSRLKAKAEQPEIKIVRQYGDLPLVRCHPGPLNQVFMNILNNAIDAFENLPDFTDNTLAGGSQLSTSNFELQHRMSHSSHITSRPPSITIRTYIDEGHQIQICIADNGQGMLAEVQQKLFDPFFTTKPVGKGTGMGLAICYQIIADQHQGTIEVSSAPGQGTEFNIILPCQQLMNNHKCCNVV